MKLPQLFHLRKLVIKRKKAETVIIYVYRNYRNTISGTIEVNERRVKGCPREYAKRQVIKLHNDAEFWV